MTARLDNDAKLPNNATFRRMFRKEMERVAKERAASLAAKKATTNKGEAVDEDEDSFETGLEGPQRRKPKPLRVLGHLVSSTYIDPPDGASSPSPSSNSLP